MTRLLLAAALGAYCTFWFAMAIAADKTDGHVWWMPFAILAMVGLPAVLGVALGIELTKPER
ncbi:hypothetical protein [Cupriavidus sp. CuC1]|uniref:hypothetical protein n=1 Tax=Cupriavidus sp. CuC1 TaxID=3373131 RepID=UPI0037D85C65